MTPRSNWQRAVEVEQAAKEARENEARTKAEAWVTALEWLHMESMS